MTPPDKSALLDSLKIDRKPPPAGPSRAVWVIVGAVVLALLAGGGWYALRADTVTIQAITVQAAGGDAASGLDASGYVVARRKATLSAKILGKLTEVNFEEGDHVKAGDIVARLDDSNYRAALDQAEATAHEAKVTMDNTQPIYARYAKLYSQGAISADTFENQRLNYDTARAAYGVAQAQVASAQSLLRDTLVRAPFSGVVTVKVAQVGEVVAPSAAGGGDTRTGIVTIVGMNSLEVLVDVSENYIDRVAVNGPVVIHLDAYPDWDIPGRVIAIIPTANESKGTVAVRVAIDTKDKRILPQMAARVAFLDVAKAGAPPIHQVSVPVQAVEAHGRTGTVFVVKGDNTLEKRDVALGPTTGQTVTVLSGIAAGDRLATGNLSSLHDSEHVTVADQH